MAFVVADRVAETSTTTGTGTYTLAGAKAGYRSFAAIGNANVTFYVATDGVDWEVGVGTYTASGTTLARTAILASSNANSAVDWTAGTRDIAATNPAARSFWNLAAGLIKGDGAGTVSAVAVSSYIETLLDDADAATARATLGFTTSLSAFTDPQGADYALAFDGTTLKIITFNALAGGKQTIFVPAGAMVSTTTNGAADGTTELATNDVMLKSKDFDTSTLEKAQFSVTLPKSYNGGTVTFRPYWTAASGSGGVAISLAARAFSNDDPLDTAFGTAVTVTDTLITANDLHDAGESGAVTIAGTPADHDLLIFEVSRAVSNGSDTLGVDMKLLGVAVYFTTDVRDDA